MTKDYSRFRVQLEEEKVRLEQSLAKIAFRDDHNPEDWVPRRDNLNISNAEELEVADEIGEYEENTATVKELETRWNEVKAALQRMEDGTYGVDEISGEEIPLERLEANPAARTSVANAPYVEQEPTPENEID